MRSCLGFFLSALFLCGSLHGAVINVTVLDKKVAGRVPQRIYFVSNRHLRPALLPKQYSIDDARRLVGAQTEVLEEFFDRLEQSVSSSSTIIEAHSSLKKHELDALRLPAFLCKCMHETGNLAWCSQEGGSYLEHAVEEEASINSLLFLARIKEKDPKVLLINPRGYIESMLDVLSMLYPVASSGTFSYMKQCLRVPGAKASVESFFKKPIQEINEAITMVRAGMSLLSDANNKQKAATLEHYLLSHREVIKELKEQLASHATKPFIQNIIEHIDALHGQIQELIAFFDSIELAELLDYYFLDIILGPQAPSTVVINAGALHTMTLVSMLKQEGYSIAYDSGLMCSDGFGGKRKVSLTLENYQKCFKDDSIKALEPIELKDMLDEAQRTISYKDEL